MDTAAQLAYSLESVASPVTEAEAAVLLRQYYGLEVVPERLGGEKDSNFRVSAPSGPFIFKVADPTELFDSIDFQTQALIHIERHAPDLPLPRLIAGLDGEVQSTASLADGTQRIIRLTSFLPGRVAVQADVGEAFYASLGQALAKMDRALASFSHPGEARVISWDLQHSLALRPLLDGLQEADLRELCEGALQGFASIAGCLPQLRAQVIHNDTNRHNLLVSDAPSPVLTGIIDFGDAVRGPLVQELAIAIAHQLLPHCDSLAVARAIIASFSSVLPLQQEEMDVLFPLIAMRLAMVVLIAEWRAQRDVRNSAYILKNHASALSGLRRLAVLSPSEISAAFRDAATMEL